MDRAKVDALLGASSDEDGAPASERGEDDAAMLGAAFRRAMKGDDDVALYDAVQAIVMRCME